MSEALSGRMTFTEGQVHRVKLKIKGEADVRASMHVHEVTRTRTLIYVRGTVIESGQEIELEIGNGESR